MLGQLLDHRYKITEVLAKGGFGQTYLAQDTRRPGHPVCVVKQLIATTANTKPETLNVIHRLFNSEAEVLERLGKHDQIPQLLAHFNEDQEFYLVQEFVVGHPLLDELSNGQAWAEATVIDFLSDILNVLDFVHSQGVIHRDIKPANIIRRDSDNRLVLIDFGAVKELKTSLASNQQTIEIGTPGYVPIEQIRGYPQFNSDIYSVGVIAIQAATGLGMNELASLLDLDSPFRGDREWQMYTQLSPKLISLIEKMVCSDYRRRYQSIKEVQIDLGQIIHAQAQITPDTVIGSVAENNLSQPTAASQLPTRAVSHSEPSVAKTVLDVTANPSSNQPSQNQTRATPHLGQSNLVRLLLCVGGGIFVLISLLVGLLNLRDSPGVSDSRPTPTPSMPGPDTPTSTSPYFENLRACEANSTHTCEGNSVLFDEAEVSKVQVTAIVKGLKKGDKVNVVIKFQGPAGATEKPYPVAYEVQGFEEEKIYAVVGRSPEGWNLGIYTFEFTAQGKPGPPAQKRFAVLKDGKLQR